MPVTKQHPKGSSRVPSLNLWLGGPKSRARGLALPRGKSAKKTYIDLCRERQESLGTAKSRNPETPFQTKMKDSRCQGNR